MAAQLILKNDGIFFKGVDMSCGASARFYAGESTGIIAHTTKAPVVAEAKRLGLPQKSICRGYSNFFKFWFIGQQQGDTFRVWRKNGEWVDFPFDHSIVTY
jgi:hypothetical protein